MATVARAAAPPTVAGIPATARLHVVTGKGAPVRPPWRQRSRWPFRRRPAHACGGGGGPAGACPALRCARSFVQGVSAQRRPSGAAKCSVCPSDAEQALLEYLDMFYSLKRSARALRRMGAIDFVTTLAPGLRDILITRQAQGGRRSEPEMAGRNTTQSCSMRRRPGGSGYSWTQPRRSSNSPSSGRSIGRAPA